MRVTVEETEDKTENKRRCVVECELDRVNIEETLEMIMRGLLSYGYVPQDISRALHNLLSPPKEKKEAEKPSEQTELGDI